MISFFHWLVLCEIILSSDILWLHVHEPLLIFSVYKELFDFLYFIYFPMFYVVEKKTLCDLVFNLVTFMAYFVYLLLG